MLKKRSVYGILLIFIISFSLSMSFISFSLFTPSSFESHVMLNISNYNIQSNWWSTTGNPISRTAGNKTNIQMIWAGTGTIIIWQDNRSGNWDIYASSIDVDGFIERIEYMLLDYKWNFDGIAICTAAGDQINPQLVADTAGGAYIVWQDNRTGNWNIYAQRITRQGKLCWTQDGLPICTEPGNQVNPKIISDSKWGAIISWADNRTSANNYDIYAQRIDGSGASLWTANGTMICNATGIQNNQVMCLTSDDNAAIIWEDLRGSNIDLYAQKINLTGGLQWENNGSLVCNSDGDQKEPQTVSVSEGEIIITWEDKRNTNSDIFAQKLNSTGKGQWGNNGTVVCNDSNSQMNPKICEDSKNGAIISWLDNRTSGNQIDLYGQRMNSSGSALWTLNGTMICNSTAVSVDNQMIKKNYGAIVVWSDNRTGNYGIYSQYIGTDAHLHYGQHGRAICTENNDQVQPKLCKDGRNGAYIAWIDKRNAIDVYAQRISSDGRVAPLDYYIGYWKSYEPNFPIIITILLVFGIPLCSAFGYCLIQMKPDKKKPEIQKKRRHPRREV
ncbi:MAG: hypothetical protein ACTSO9_06545 [Candidatus Helarchaeota archaeon]